MTAGAYVPARGLPAPGRRRRRARRAATGRAPEHHELWVQRCAACGTWQWGPEWICHHCHSLRPGLGAGAEPAGASTPGSGSGTRCTRPWATPAPTSSCWSSCPHAGDVRMVGNLLGDPLQPVAIGDPVRAAFEDHDDAEVPYTLVQWELLG